MLRRQLRARVGQHDARDPNTGRLVGHSEVMPAAAWPCSPLAGEVDRKGCFSAPLNHGNGNHALELLRPAAGYDATDSITLYVRANAYLQSGKPQEAVQEFQRIRN